MLVYVVYPVIWPDSFCPVCCAMLYIQLYGQVVSLRSAAICFISGYMVGKFLSGLLRYVVYPVIWSGSFCPVACVMLYIRLFGQVVSVRLPAL